jgi:signal transduction histidine kinase/BarA-like signal transduction histidine kinase
VADDHERSRLTVAATLVGAAALAMFSIIHIALGVPSMAAALGLASGLVALGPMVLRRTRSVRFASNWGIAWTFAAIAYVVWVGGGLLSPALQFLSVLVLAAVLLAGGRSGAIWAGAGVIWVFIIYVYEAAGGVLPSHVDTQHIAFMWMPTTVGILLVTLAMAALYAYYERLALDALERSNQALARARDLAEAGLRARTSFVAHMSHEIRTPMNAVIGLTDLMLSEDATPGQRENLAMIRESGEHLLAVINDILDFSKSEAGRIELEPRRFDLETCVRSSVQMLALSAAKKKVALSTDLPAETPRHVLGDEGRLRQVLVNLVSNAVKFTDAGEVVVRVASRALSGDRLELAISVTDTGIGIAAEQRERLFEPFTQGDASTTRRFGGTGLGLVISRRLCEAMGGTLTVDSEPGRGSTFTARVAVGPAATPALLEQPTARETAVASPTERSREARVGSTAVASSLRILLVEDNALNRDIALQILAVLGYRADLAGDGLEALAALERQRYDVVLMDVQMPNMDGLTAARHIHQRWPGPTRPRIIAMTASAQAEDREACLDAGMDDYMSKPFRFEDLRARLAVCVSLD